MSLARFGVNGTPASAPPAGFLYLYMKSDKLLYFMDDTGTETPVRPVGGGTGDLLSDGTVPLVADWNVGLFKITVNQLESVIATGTAPLIVASQTLVANLNAQFLQGMEPVDEDNMVSDSAVKLPTQQSVKAYVDTKVTGAFIYQGVYDASTNTPDLDTTPSGSIKKGWIYIVSVAGTFFTTDVEVGDVLVAEIDAPTVEADWSIIQGNIQYNAAQIKSLYESNSDTNALTDALLALINAAIVDADYSSTEGIQRKSGAGTYTTIKTNLNASADPGVSDDSSAGYGVFSPWVNTTASPRKVFICKDASVGAADWQELGAGAGGGLTASVKTANYELTESEDVACDSSGGSFTITLKASPDAGDVAVIRDVGHAANTYPITIARNGSTIEGAAADEELNVDNGIYWFVFDGSTWNFTPITVGGLNQTQVDARVALYAPASGTFSPTVQDDSASDAEGQTYSTQNGRYRVVGDLVFFWLDIVVTSLGTLTTTQQARIAGLPFTAANDVAQAVSVGLAQNLAITSGQTVAGFVAGNTTKINLYLWDATGGTTNFLLSELTGSGRLILSGVYAKA